MEELGEVDLGHFEDFPAFSFSFARLTTNKLGNLGYTEGKYPPILKPDLVRAAGLGIRKRKKILKRGGLT